MWKYSSLKHVGGLFIIHYVLKTSSKKGIVLSLILIRSVCFFPIIITNGLGAIYVGCFTREFDQIITDGMVFAAYLLEKQFWCCPSRGGSFSPHFKALRRGFCMNARPHCGEFAAFPKQNDRCSTNAWGGGGGGHAWNWLSHYFTTMMLCSLWGRATTTTTIE